jgi:hypothetical protein
MNNNSFNFRNPSPGEVLDIQARVKRRREQLAKYKVLSQILAGKTVDLTQSSVLFEALNREKMEFDELLKLHPDQAKDCVDQAKEDREAGVNIHSKAKWACRGHIPPCLFYSRPKEYWKDKNIIREFFRMYPKFGVVK